MDKETHEELVYLATKHGAQLAAVLQVLHEVALAGGVSLPGGLDVMERFLEVHQEELRAAMLRADAELAKRLGSELEGAGG